ncbi:AMSH-like protease isoform X5 [Sebastes umbrosus]|uniref:AMSH-like protease isoform X5 n=1 Tax=Sebastes umbrosus TaxID=72105 RepID=UPI00189D045C|nr:AMSH-like protease isoform X5 [Sebastes umbrosus]
MDEPAVGQSEEAVTHTHTHTHTHTMEQGFSLNTLKKLAAEPDYTDVSLTAAERVRALGKMGCSVEINEDVAPRRYLRSGVEMERMAAVYLEEGSLENAYVLYTKFITLFVEKLPGHRDYQHCSLPEKQLIMKKLQEVAFPRKDELKKRLQEKYSREHSEYLRAQSQAAAAVVDGCGQQLQRLSLLGEDRRRCLLLEEERQRVAALRRMQIESEQFRFFEDQLRRQELANRRGEEAELKVETKVPEVTDGSCLSQQPIRDSVRSQGADPNRNRPAAPVSQSAATLAGVHEGGGSEAGGDTQRSDLPLPPAGRRQHRQRDRDLRRPLWTTDAQRVPADSRRDPQTVGRSGFLRHGERGGTVQFPGPTEPADARLDTYSSHSDGLPLQRRPPHSLFLPADAAGGRRHRLRSQTQRYRCVQAQLFGDVGGFWLQTQRFPSSLQGAASLQRV